MKFFFLEYTLDTIIGTQKLKSKIFLKYIPIHIHKV